MKTSEDLRRELVKRAREIRRNAYAPYSNYTVGAALLASSGQIYEGVNVENAAYPTSMCAERTAVFRAASSGERTFTAIAVVTDNGGSPCGACRQVLAEFGFATEVIIANARGDVVMETTVGDLLPAAFGPTDLANP